MYYNNTQLTFDKITEPYINQTRKYLTPTLKYYGEEFIENMRSNQILMTGIQDYGINKSNTSKELQPHIYFLFDVNGHATYGHYVNIKKSRITFSQSLNYFQNHESYITDYTYDSNLKGHLHVVVLKIPDTCAYKFKLFLDGAYSEMYTPEECNKLLVKEIEIDVLKNNKVVKTRMLTDIYCVMTKTPEYFEIFKDKVYTEFGTRLTEGDGREYDFPPYMRNEVLRFNTTELKSLTI